MSCPCMSKKKYQECCETLIKGKEHAKTAEQLMRARYSAYAKNEISYIEKTQGHDPDNTFDREAASKWATESKWLGLEVVKTHARGEKDNEGFVEFIASYEDANGPHKHQERSRFVKQDNQWFFHSGSIVGLNPITRETPKIGRNDPCHCGSGKKFKKCCGN